MAHLHEKNKNEGEISHKQHGSLLGNKVVKVPQTQLSRILGQVNGVHILQGRP